MNAQRTLLTAVEFFQLYSHKDGRYELVKGEVIKVPLPGGVHGGIAVNVASVLGTIVRQRDLGRVVLGNGIRLEARPGPLDSMTQQNHQGGSYMLLKGALHNFRLAAIWA